MTLSRRHFLLVSAVTTLSVSGIPALAAGDAYATLRARWRDLLTGVGYNAAAEPFKSALQRTGQQAEAYRAAMSPGTSSLWPDLPIGSVSANVTQSHNRLRTMALAYVQPGTGHTASPTVLAALKTGLKWLNDHAYTAGRATYGNWWDWQIGTPQSLLDTCVLIDAPLLADHLAAVDHYVPSSLVTRYSGTSTGANRVDLCRVLALRGVLGASGAKLTTARDALSPVFPYVLTGDGMYPDGSFVQHTYVPYAGGYGAVLLGGLAQMLTLLSGSAWAVTDPNRQLVLDAATTTFAPWIMNGLVMDGVSGRGISRGEQTDHTRGHAIMGSILVLAASGLGTSAEVTRWRGLVKGWIGRGRYSPYLDDPAVGVPELALAKAVVDSTVPAAAQPVGHRLFASMDRAIHQRPQWMFSVSMSSARTTFYETGNGENLRGWHTGSGQTYWWGDTYGNGQYSDAFWPTVDPYRLPGTTVSRKTLADAAGGDWSATRPPNTWAGGASDGTYAALGQDVRGLQSTLTGRKSWFCLDDQVVCLGAGITSADGVPVDSVVDNRNLGASGTHPLVVDGTTQPAALGWTRRFTGAKWMALGGFGGYVFPGGATVDAGRFARTGRWRDINKGGSTDNITRRYLTLWFDHGKNPAGAGYSYVLLPGAGAAATAARAANPSAVVLANTAAVQGISAPGTHAANFFAAGTCGPITVNAPCSVLVRRVGEQVTVTVADPTREATTVLVTLSDNGFTSASGDPTVTVLDTSGTTRLLVEVGGSLGRGHTVTLGTGTAVGSQTFRTVPPSADAFVRDGTYADTAYGTDPTLVVKAAAGSGYTRQSYLEFDLSGLASAPTRAVLWVHGAVSDADGTHTTLSANGVTAAWSESVTWNTRPALGAVVASRLVSTAADWVPLDVTAFVRGRFAVDRVVSLGLRGSPLAVVLGSREAAAGRPFLEVLT
ncbi:polysaccharide lyase family 8 super-sandwich domain-containing protein [Amycolatopsis sp. CA-128772]|uniref:polysaccharide lyase family 8 super-sandwich domain-containing protein n=1 Tax=Amycolatopsis sp. CA-128772 TaxID=2073159 RepID=UPI000CD251D6|nr:polysaccharide lyase family 8 super-sandwich domain-containing protein [Amycolatopsis sp. CA-128772]